MTFKSDMTFTSTVMPAVLATSIAGGLALGAAEQAPATTPAEHWRDGVGGGGEN